MSLKNYTYTGTVASGENPITKEPITPPSWQGKVQATQYTGGSTTQLAKDLDATIKPSPIKDAPAGAIVVEKPLGEAIQRYQALKGQWIVLASDGAIIVWADDFFGNNYKAA